MVRTRPSPATAELDLARDRAPGAGGIERRAGIFAQPVEGEQFRGGMVEPESAQTKRQEMIEEYRETFYTPYVAAGQRLVDDIIEPAETRGYLAEALDSLSSKRDWGPAKKHGLIPL